jgi:hypothetical protein
LTVEAVNLREFAIQIPARSRWKALPGATDLGDLAGDWLKDLSGHPLAADYHAGFTLDRTPPEVTSVTASSTGGVIVHHVDITFSEPIYAGSFTASQVALVGLSGPIAVGDPSRVSSNTFRVPFAGQRADGVYTLTVAPEIMDLAGNTMSTAFTARIVIALPSVLVTPLPSDAMGTGVLPDMGAEAEGEDDWTGRALPDWEELLDSLAADVSRLV